MLFFFFNLSESDVVTQINLGAVDKSRPFKFCFQLFSVKTIDLFDQMWELIVIDCMF